MAIYEYEIMDSSGKVVGVYEAEQGMNDPALTRHPKTGQALRRILSRTFASVSSSGAGCESGGCDVGACDTGTCCSGGACGFN